MKLWTAISGCSGGGKSSLLAELDRKGFLVVEEPGRRIIAEEHAAGSIAALPWIDPIAFARRAVAMSQADRKGVRAERGRVFFDRGLVDAAVALEHATGTPQVDRLCQDDRYGDLVFMAPPWPEIFITDDARRHDMTASLAEYERLLAAYARLGYTIEVLPKIGVEARADFILSRLGV